MIYSARVCSGTLFIGDKYGAFLCIPMKIGVKFEHWYATGSTTIPATAVLLFVPERYPSAACTGNSTAANKQPTLVKALN